VLNGISRIQSLGESQSVGLASNIVFSNRKEKSWSVKLVSGSYYDTNNGHVRSGYCGDCRSNAELIAVNSANPRLVLLGCSDRKCHHRLIKFET
jgi:hypothetical protein